MKHNQTTMGSEWDVYHLPTGAGFCNHPQEFSLPEVSFSFSLFFFSLSLFLRLFQCIYTILSTSVQMYVYINNSHTHRLYPYRDNSYAYTRKSRHHPARSRIPLLSPQHMSVCAKFEIKHHTTRPQMTQGHGKAPELSGHKECALACTCCSVSAVACSNWGQGNGSETKAGGV